MSRDRGGAFRRGCAVAIVLCVGLTAFASQDPVSVAERFVNAAPGLTLAHHGDLCGGLRSFPRFSDDPFEFERTLLGLVPFRSAASLEDVRTVIEETAHVFGLTTGGWNTNLWDPIHFTSLRPPGFQQRRDQLNVAVYDGFRGVGSHEGCIAVMRHYSTAETTELRDRHMNDRLADEVFLQDLFDGPLAAYGRPAVVRTGPESITLNFTSRQRDPVRFDVRVVDGLLEVTPGAPAIPHEMSPIGSGVTFFGVRGVRLPSGVRGSVLAFDLGTDTDVRTIVTIGAESNSRDALAWTRVVLEPELRVLVAWNRGANQYTRMANRAHYLTLFHQGTGAVEAELTLERPIARLQRVFGAPGGLVLCNSPHATTDVLGRTIARDQRLPGYLWTFATGEVTRLEAGASIGEACLESTGLAGRPIPRWDPTSDALIRNQTIAGWHPTIPVEASGGYGYEIRTFPREDEREGRLVDAVIAPSGSPREGSAANGAHFLSVDDLVTITPVRIRLWRVDLP